jgi:transposase
MQQAVLADKAYDTDAQLDYIIGKNTKTVIPQKTNLKEQTKFDQQQYQNLNLIERFVALIKQFQKISTRYDQLASHFASFVPRTVRYFGSDKCQQAYYRAILLLKNFKLY